MSSKNTNNGRKQSSSSSKKTNRKDFASKYPPLFKKIEKDLSRSSASSIADKLKNKRRSSEDLPDILKSNIAALSESTESIKLTDFGKSFVEIDDFDSPPKKKKSFFDNLLSNDAKSLVMQRSNFENKRLLDLKNESKQVGLLSSPSMMNAKLTPPSPVNKFPQNDSKNELSANEAFEKMKNDELNESKTFKDDKIINQKEQPSQAPKSNTPKCSDEEKLGSSSESNKSVDLALPDFSDFGGRVLMDYKESLNNFKKLVGSVKQLNDKILAYRQELSEAMNTEFPNTQPDNP